MSEIDLNLEIKKNLVKKHYNIDLIGIDFLCEINFCQYIYIKFRQQGDMSTLTSEQTKNIVNHPNFESMNLYDEKVSFAVHWNNDCVMEEEYNKTKKAVHAYINQMFMDKE